MLTSKQRANLRGLANNRKAIFQIGKGDIGDALIKQIDEALEARELIKISVLQTSMLSARDASNVICERTGAEAVSTVGNKLIIYKESVNNKIIEV